MSHPAFSSAELNICPSAYIEDAYVYQSVLSNDEPEVTVKWEKSLRDDEGNRHWVNQKISMTLEQARKLHDALGIMLTIELPEQGKVKWVISDGDLEEEYQPANA